MVGAIANEAGIDSELTMPTFHPCITDNGINWVMLAGSM
ncbi:MAG: hypothetical protein ACYTA5_14570 [Planctomycetota bacterium]